MNFDLMRPGYPSGPDLCIREREALHKLKKLKEYLYAQAELNGELTLPKTSGNKLITDN